MEERSVRRLVSILLVGVASAVLLPAARATSWRPTSGELHPPCRYGSGREAFVTGVVVDERGRPIAGATVEASGRWEVWDVACFASTRSASDGRFRLSFSEERSYQILASSPGRSPALSSVVVLLSEPIPPLRLALGPGHAVAGRVTDDAGRPIAGAWLALRHDRPGSEAGQVFNHWRPDDDRFRARAGSDGRFTFRDLPAGILLLDIRAPGVAFPLRGAAVEVKARTLTTDLGTLVLPRGDRLRGRVVDPSGRAVAGAQVWLLQENSFDWDWGEGLLAAGPAARSGADGRFSLTGFDGSSIEVCRSGYLRAELPRPKDGEPLAVELRPAASFSGRVVDASGRPVASAEIQAAPGWQIPAGDLITSGTPCRHLLSTHAESDRLGRFVVTNVEPGWARLEVEAAGFAHTASQPLYGAAGETVAGLEVPLSRGATLSGRVTRPDGRPLPGAFVSVSSGDGRASREYRVTDARGEYSLQLEPGAYSVEASDERRIRVPAGGARLDFVAPEPEDLHPRSGRILDAGGQPIGGALVETLAERAWTDADGRYTLAGGSPALLAKVTAAGYATAQSWATQAEVRLASSHQLTGRLLGLTPRDRTAVEIQAEPVDAAPEARGLPITGAADLAGHYRIDGLAAGKWKVTVSTYENGAKAEVEVKASSRITVQDLRLSPRKASQAAAAPLAVRPTTAGAVLTGTVAGLAPGEVATLSLDNSTGSTETRTDRAGRYRISGVPAGNHTLFAILGQPYGWTIHREVSLPVGASEATVDLAFPPRDHSLVVHLTGATDLLALSVILLPSERPWPPVPGRIIPDEDGRARYDHLPAGRYEIQVLPQGSHEPLAKRELDLSPEAKTTELAIDLAGGDDFGRAAQPHL